METSPLQPDSLSAQPDSNLQELLAGEIEQIRNADLPKSFIEEEIAALRKRFSKGTYRPGSSPLLPENVNKPLRFEIGQTISESD